MSHHTQADEPSTPDTPSNGKVIAAAVGVIAVFAALAGVFWLARDTAPDPPPELFPYPTTEVVTDTVTAPPVTDTKVVIPPAKTDIVTVPPGTVTLPPVTETEVVPPVTETETTTVTITPVAPPPETVTVTPEPPATGTSNRIVKSSGVGCWLWFIPGACPPDVPNEPIVHTPQTAELPHVVRGPNGSAKVE